MSMSIYSHCILNCVIKSTQTCFHNFTRCLTSALFSSLLHLWCFCCCCFTMCFLSLGIKLLDLMNDSNVGFSSSHFKYVPGPGPWLKLLIPHHYIMRKTSGKFKETYCMFIFFILKQLRGKWTGYFMKLQKSETWPIKLLIRLSPHVALTRDPFQLDLR